MIGTMTENRLYMLKRLNGFGEALRQILSLKKGETVVRYEWAATSQPANLSEAKFLIRNGFVSKDSRNGCFYITSAGRAELEK